MITFPNAKINLGLRILRKREDGYHDLDTVFYPVPLNDALEIIQLPSHEYTSAFPFSLTGTEVKGRLTSNLCVLAYKLLKKDYPQLPKIKMHLHKIIPSGAGLGGGSSDAAFTLMMLNNMFGLGISTEKLILYAAELGSDCPFFIINQPCYGSKKGDQLQPVELNLSDYSIMIVNPGIHIDTGLAFLNVTPAIPDKSVKEIISTLPVERWKDELQNDFEKVIFPRFNEIVDIKDEFYRNGAVYASMSGSGSTVYGIFKKGTEPQLSFPPHYFVKQLAGQL